MRWEIVCFVGVLAIVLAEDNYLFETKYIDVPLDHFSFAQDTKFQLRYLINDTYHEDRGPIFFYTGNEGDIKNFAKNTGFMYDIAPTFSALLVFVEHRYYGESLPFGNQSYSSIDKLGYLSSQQALADFVYVIEALQEQYAHNQKNLPVIAFGGSYGGMLSSWIRMKYPSSVLGAIASSAPIWQLGGLTSCEIFNRITTSVYASFGTDKCTNGITNVWKTIRSFTKTAEGKANLTSTWNLCSPIKTDDDINQLIDWAAELIVNMAMVNYPYPTNFLADLPAYPVREFCNRLNSHKLNGDYDLLVAVVDGLGVYTNYTKTAKCNNINVTSPSLSDNGWNFQSCTDMIMPMCSQSSDMFENANWDFAEFSDTCYKQFKVRPRNLNVPLLEYGGKDIEAASNIVFSNGLLDPWSGGGVLRNINDRVRSIIIPDGAHHYDLRGKNDLDTEDVKYARNFHVRKIKEWLREYYSDPQVNLIKK
ncbi:lysosomal Pro-X carboxypeptidase [Diabrotica virgifera virgifera]|uniref:Lysosomal Pro-X carboxypeptidase n=1 Tax=Diabrotica virgifera virgifera TaxID=50390 RepID=A0A6P7FK06_DIAVI|nr:lysosomal Pro-X carboxypeptidase [Diabrotica virgifera virgifera]